MAKRRVFDKDIGIVALSALLTLGGASLFVCPTANAGSAAPTASAPASRQPNAPRQPNASHQPTEASKTAMTIESDDDGDELLEHWSDPKFSREERLQIALIVGGLSVGAGVGALRRKKMRRVAANG